jgi:hypothetical protein
LHFHAIGDLGTGSDINITDGVLSGIKNLIPATWIGDHIEVSVVPGDADGDGVINVIDMTRVARTVLQVNPSTAGADCNQDSNINVLDMTCIARKILGLD